MQFIDREDAGRRLANELTTYPLVEPIVVGLPRGGVPVAAVVAAKLGVPLDVLVVRKLAYPREPSLGIGAVAEGGVRLLDDEVLATVDISSAQLEGLASDEHANLQRRVRYYRGARDPLPVEGRAVVLVDDGVASGLLARSAIEVLRRRGAASIVLAIPVGPRRTMQDLRQRADDVVCLHEPRSFTSIRAAYRHFPHINDDEVVRTLALHAPQQRTAVAD